MTIQQAKDALPMDINIRMPNGTIQAGRVVGRQLKFAQVYLQYSSLTAFEVSWQAVARAITSNQPITI